MSPLSVRRFRAERLLRAQFEALRVGVIAAASARLRGNGVTLDRDDLEVCYASAWQGLYTAMLDGQEIENPAAWLALVTFRRAVDEHRARGRAPAGADLTPLDVDVPNARTKRAAHEPDLAGEIDDRTKLRQLFEGLRGRLSAREREAAVLCYLQGLSRAQAAERMGVSEARLRKLMEGSGVGRPGVAGKVGALVETIREGGWCEEQGSLMRAFAYGVLDPHGERYQLAMLHSGDCPSCRAYVASLRGLAATLPPVFLPWGLGAAALARVGGVHVGAAAGTASGGAGGASAGGGAGVGAMSASGAAAGAGAGASGFAGGGWLFAGGAKLAAGCVLALSVGAGCVALDVGDGQHPPAHRHRAAHGAGAIAGTAAPVARGRGLQVGRSSATGARSATAALTTAGRTSREFGPEQTSTTNAHTAVRSERPQASRARASSNTTAQASTARSPGSPGSASAAEREFSPG